MRTRRLASVLLYRDPPPYGRRGPDGKPGCWRITIVATDPYGMVCGALSRTRWDAAVEEAQQELAALVSGEYDIAGELHWQPDPDREGWWSAAVD